MSYNIKINNFEGPFDLLFHLIEKEEMDIYDIPISQITIQYLEHIKKMETLDLEIASEFLLMAATLLEIKSKMLLPKPEKINKQADSLEVEDPRAQLVQRLLEYKKFKELAFELKQREKKQEGIYYRKHYLEEYYDLKNYPIKDLSVNDLINSLEKVLSKELEKKSYHKVAKERISIKDKMVQLYKKLIIVKKLVFNKLFSQTASKLEVIVTFLAVLELAKLRKVIIVQKKIFDNIFIYKNDSINEKLNKGEGL